MESCARVVSPRTQFSLVLATCSSQVVVEQCFSEAHGCGEFSVEPWDAARFGTSFVVSEFLDEVQVWVSGWLVLGRLIAT